MDAYVKLRNWPFALAHDAFTPSEGLNDLRGAKFATFISKADYLEFVPVKAAISVQRFDHMIKITEDGAPAVGFLVLERNNGKIVRAVFTDFRGCAMIIHSDFEVYSDDGTLCVVGASHYQSQ